MNDLADCRARIAQAEEAVMVQRARLQADTYYARERVRGAADRWQRIKAPLIVGGGLLLGLSVGLRRGGKRSDVRPHARHERPAEAPPSGGAETARAAGKAAGWLAALSLVGRIAPVALGIARIVAEQRGRVDGAVGASRTAGGMDWWALARGVAPLLRR
jgi:hypothetical protein